jgi:TM2 domain-containing membrane protein YozV
MTTTTVQTDQKSFVVTLLLCLLLGVVGVHRFYVGKVGTGILQIVTLGGLGVWVLVDFIVILTGSFKDKQGRPLGR